MIYTNQLTIVQFEYFYILHVCRFLNTIQRKIDALWHRETYFFILFCFFLFKNKNNDMGWIYKKNQNIIRRLHFIVYAGIISHVILGAVKIKARTLGYIGVVLVCFCYAIIHTRSFCIIKPIKDTNFMIMHFITSIADYRTTEETFYYYCAYFLWVYYL